MKKKFLGIIVFIFIISFFTISKVQAESLSFSYYDKNRDCVDIVSSSSGGVLYASSIGHSDIVYLYFGEDKPSYTITDDTWIHMKGIVSTNIYRIKVSVNGKTCQSRLFDTNNPSKGLIQLNADRTFEVHCKAKDFLKTTDGLQIDSLNKLGFEMYIGDSHDAASQNESLELLGVCLNNSQTYSNWSTPVQREEHTCNWSTEWFNDFSCHWHTCLNGCKTLNSYEPHTFSNGVCSDCGATEPGDVAFGIMSTDSEIITIEGAVDGGSGKITFLESGKASISIPVENVLTSSHKWLSVKLTVSDGITIRANAYGVNKTGETQKVNMCSDIFNEWNSLKYLETYDEFLIANAKVEEYLPGFSTVSSIILDITGVAGDVVEIMDIALTFDGVHQFETPIIEPEEEGPISNIAIPKGFDATYQKNENGEQTITYSQSPEYKLFEIKVTEYDPTNTILEVVFGASSDTTVCLQINGKIDWDLGGHILYPGERKSKIVIDLASFDYELGTEFIVGIYIDATQKVNETKSITFKSITFKTPEPEPEGMYIKDPTSSNMGCFEGVLGDEVRWTYGDWSSVEYKVKKYDQEYDVLAINMSVISGMNLGIRITWNEVIDGELIESSEDIRNHWTSEGLFTTTGDIELIFLLKVHGLQNKNITSVILYFDPPTNNYIPNEGTQECTIYSLDFYKSSELNLKPLEIIANPMSTDYTGQSINFVAQNEYDYETIVEYSHENSTDWTTDAPVNAGTYRVRIKFLGSLTHDYSVAYSTLIINKVKATVAESDVYVDPETGIVTIANGIIAALSEDFAKESLIKTGFTIDDNSTIYFYHPADENYHTDSEKLSIIVKLDSTPELPDDSELPSDSEDSKETDEQETPGTNDTNPSKDNSAGCNGGCSGSIIISIFGILTLAGVVSILKRKI